LCFGRERTRQTHKRFMFMVMVACKHGVINGYVRKQNRRGGKTVTYTKEPNERSDPEMSTAVCVAFLFARGRKKGKQQKRDLMISILLFVMYLFE
jgi:hypothetical protein